MQVGGVHSAAMTEDPAKLLLQMETLSICENQVPSLLWDWVKHLISGTTVSKDGLGVCSLFSLIILCPTRKQYPENIQISMQVMSFKTWHSV